LAVASFDHTRVLAATKPNIAAAAMTFRMSELTVCRLTGSITCESR
jgi:hypothetical protein